MKRLIVLLAIVAMVIFSGCPPGVEAGADNYIKLAARRASVQTNFFIPIIKVSFTEPLKEKEPLSEKDVEKLLEKKIAEALEAEREAAKIDKYESNLTAIDTFYKPVKSYTEIPLGALAPKHARFPDKVLVVWKTQKKEVNPFGEDYDDDVLMVSETANVSISQARMMLMQLQAAGYSVTRDEADPESEIELFFYDSWTDSYPKKLNWNVTVEGSNINIIQGYDPRGILIVSRIPEDKRVFVEAGYHDLKEAFKPKDEVTEGLKKEVAELKEKLAIKEKEEKRDISKATNYDVLTGRVKLEIFWAQTSASGVFLGNMKVRKEADGWQSSWDYDKHSVIGKKKGVVLTNAHVADMGVSFKVYVSKDKEIMLFVLPADSYIRYTRDSDIYGSPAQVMAYDFRPVMSWDFDCALMVTTEVPQYQKHRALLGDSDNVKEGDPVVSVGNPALMQKFMTTGIVSRLDYSIMQSQGSGAYFKDLDRGTYVWAMNSNFWYDSSIGVGGTSGSGVWAMSGPESGKVVALHNMGLSSVRSFSSAINDGKEIDCESLVIPPGLLRNTMRETGKSLFANYDHKDATFDLKMEDMEKDGLPVAKMCGIAIDIPGMNGAVPINKIKAFLQERGIDPGVFEWSALRKGYWVK